MTFKQPCFYSILFLVWPSLLWGIDREPNQELLALCPSSSLLHNYSPPPIFAADKLGETNISAVQVKSIGSSSSAFTGNVIIERHKLRLLADEVSHNKDTQQIELIGNVHADTENLSLNAKRGWFNLQTNAGELIDSEYFVPDSQFSGKTPLFSVTDQEKTILVNTQFSSCPANQLDWYLDMEWLELDHPSSTGTAKHAVLWVKDIPVFYLPWIQFPLGEERRSGLLMPSFGQTSNSGYEINIPWYWNIAANHDAIFTPSNVSRRGQMLATNYRYLTNNSNGTLDIEYLPADRLLDDKERYLTSFKNNTKLYDNLNLSLLVNDASDTEYLKDFSSNFNLSNTTHLEKNARLSYNQDTWNTSILAQTFQTVDTSLAKSSRPYRRLPQITLTAKDDIAEFSDSYLSGELKSEWVEFKHEASNKAQGSRFHINPSFSLPLQANAWFLKPDIGLMHTQYDTTDNNGAPVQLDDRTLRTFSLDSGLFFERNINNNSMIQTLEPRAFYLNIPYKDQSSIPLFDTTQQDFSFASLFRENRFNGNDRIGDAKQITMALSSRILDKESGDELMNINIGRIYYFDKQRVFLDSASPTASSSNSDIIAEFNSNLDRWRSRATIQWNTKTSASDKRNLQLSYAASDKAVFNIGYRFFRDANDENNNIEQTDLSFAWPIANNVSFLSRWNYSLTEERDIETIIGLEYESCCWALRLISQRYLNNTSNNLVNENEYNLSIMLQFVLKNFGSVSDKAATKTLKHAILGYQPDY